jgi:response regulator RpfG family c-di-GMP phosphodiesterase
MIKAAIATREESGTHFDPGLVDAFNRVESQFNAIRIAYKDQFQAAA